MTESTETNQVIIRRRKRREPRRKNNFMRTFVTRLSLLAASIFMVYMVLVLYLPWDGLWGRSMAKALLTNVGGAVAIPLLFAAYLLFAFATGRPVPSPARQSIGTLLLFLSGMTLTGLMAYVGNPPRSMGPGLMGAAFTASMTDWIGTAGTALLGVVLIFLSLFTYGITPWKGRTAGRIRLKLQSFLIKMRLFFFRMKKREVRDELADELPKETDYFVLRKKSSRTQPADEIQETYAEDEDEISNDPDDFPVVSLPAEPIEPPEPLEPPKPKAPVPADGKPVRRRTGDRPEESFPPSMELFGPAETGAPRNDPMTLRQKGLDIVTALAGFGVDAELVHSVEGPTVIQYQIRLARGVKVSKVAGLSRDIAVALAVPSLRVEAPIPGTSYVGIEIPNKKRRPVTLRSVMASDEFCTSRARLPLPLGFRVDGSPMVVGLEELPHLLVAGTTGSGKSVFVTSCITALCTTRTPSELRFILIDPKRVEMAIYENLPHVLAKPVVDPQKAVHALGWAVREMERRYEVFAGARVRQLSGYNEKVLPKDRLPQIVVVVDELADLMFTASKEVEDLICRLAQMARATGIHLILATQRPSVNVITGLIKANIPARVAFTLPSQTDSRTIIDVTGAQQLLGKGDMLFTSTKNPKPVRIQSPFIDEDCSVRIIESLRRSFGDPEYVELEDQQRGKGPGGQEISEDDRLEEAVQLVLKSGIASASRLQRQMRIGFTRAARLIDTMEHMGIVGPQEGSKPREIYADEERAEELIEEYFR